MNIMLVFDIVLETIRNFSREQQNLSSATVFLCEWNLNIIYFPFCLNEVTSLSKHIYMLALVRSYLVAMNLFYKYTKITYFKWRRFIDWRLIRIVNMTFYFVGMVGPSLIAIFSRKSASIFCSLSSNNVTVNIVGPQK